MRIKSVKKLKKPRGKQVGYGVLEVDGLEVDFRVFPSKDGGVFGSLPSNKGKDGNWYNLARFTSKQVNKEFEELLNQAWNKVSGRKEETNAGYHEEDDVPF